MPSQNKVHHKRSRKDIHISLVDCYSFLGRGGGEERLKGYIQYINVSEMSDN